MMVGYVLLGSVAGLLASLVALSFGASYMIAFGIYCLVGSSVLILLPAAQLVVQLLVHRQDKLTVPNME